MSLSNHRFGLRHIGRLRYSVVCPNCASQAIVRESRQISTTTRHSYCQCGNVACGMTFQAVTEVVHTINPPPPEAVCSILPPKVNGEFFAI